MKTYVKQTTGIIKLKNGKGIQHGKDRSKSRKRQEEMIFTIEYPKSLKGYSLNDIYAGKHWAKRKKDSDYWHWLVRGELSEHKEKVI